MLGFLIIVAFVVGISLLPSVLSSLLRILGFKPLREITSSSGTLPGLANKNFDELKLENEQALKSFLNSVSADGGYHYVDDRTVYFLKAALNGSPWAPKGEYYRTWVRNRQIPDPIRAFGRHVHDCIGAKQRELAEEKKQREDELQFERANQISSRLLALRADKIERFLAIAYRKASTVDEYGDENPEAFEQELLRFLKKLSSDEPELALELASYERGKRHIQKVTFWAFPLFATLKAELKQRFETYCLEQRAKCAVETSASISTMTGVEFEHHLIRLLRACGVTKVQGTPATGDQGGDLVFTHEGVRVVIQAKRYDGMVGNKAVQEVHAAKGFYNCDSAWVVTNSTFTASAKALAARINVLLIDGADLLRFESVFVEAFASRQTSRS